MKKTLAMAITVSAGILMLLAGQPAQNPAGAEESQPLPNSNPPAQSFGSNETLSVGVDEMRPISTAGESAEQSGGGSPKKSRVQKHERPLIRLTNIQVTQQANQPVVRIVTTGAVKSSLQYLSQPDRLLVKLSEAGLAWHTSSIEVHQPPLQAIRAAQHGREIWVVLDLSRPTRWTRRQQPTGIILAPAGVSPSSSAPEADDAQAASSTGVSSEGATYQVVDVGAETTAEKTRIIVTTDGPVRYRVQQEPRGQEISLLIYGASLAWHRRVLAQPSRAVTRVTSRQERSPEGPLVKISVLLSQTMPYSVLKEQNQVILELDNPAVSMESAPSKGNLRSRVSVDFQNADLVSVLRALAQDVGFDLILTPGVQELSGAPAQVTVTINQQPLEKVMDLILRPRKLAYEVGGNTLRVGMASEFTTETRIFTLRNIDGKHSNLKDSLEGSLTEGTKSKIILDEYGNRVIVTAIAGDLRRIETVLDHMDVQPRLVSRTFNLSYAEASKISPLLKPALSSLGTLEINERENALLLTDIPGNILRLAGLIHSLDTKSRQVMIEARIVEVALSNEQALGINWKSTNADSAATPAPAGNHPAGTLAIGSVQPGLNLSEILASLGAKGMVNLISNPRIATLDNQSATLSASQNIPYPTSIVSNGVVRSGVEYVELPITLTVTPHISGNNQVLLSPASLAVTTIVRPGNPPETQTRSATTQMRVADGETVAIGGMIRDVDNIKETKVPFFGDIPLLGGLFRGATNAKDKVELVVFLTTHVLE